MSVSKGDKFTWATRDIVYEIVSVEDMIVRNTTTGLTTTIHEYWGPTWEKVESWGYLHWTEDPFVRLVRQIREEHASHEEGA